MKLGKSKLALAKVINENGGWPERALWAVQDNCIAFFLGGKPEYKSGDRCWYSNSIDGACVGTITCDEKVTNWHQTILSREEYYNAYPKTDADGWIAWNGLNIAPVKIRADVDIKFRDGDVATVSNPAYMRWSHSESPSDIIAYRPHKQDVKPEFCESVTHGIPEPESIDGLCAKVTEENKHQHVDAKPTIEQLAQDYRNKLDFAKRKQQEADDAKASSDAALGELERAGEAVGMLVSPTREDAKAEPTITDWRDLKVGDEVEAEHYGMKLYGVITEMESDGYAGERPVRIKPYYGNAKWSTSASIKLIRRP